MIDKTDALTRLAAAHANDADEARMFLMMLGVIPSPEPLEAVKHRAA